MTSVRAKPCALLVHGTGTSSASWGPLMPYIQPHFRVLAVDLPGHGDSHRSSPLSLTLDRAADAVVEHVRRAGIEPSLVIGHSAGAAILARLLLDSALAPAAFAGLNPAIDSSFTARLTGLRGLAESLAASAATGRLLSRWFGRPWAIRRIVRHAGSTLPAAAIERYATLVRRPEQVQAALSMMACWDLTALERDLPLLRTPTLLLTGDRDPWFPPSAVERLAARMPRARARTVTASGHLMPEERPDEVAKHVLAFARETGAI